MDTLEKMSSARTSDVGHPDILQPNKCVAIIDTMLDVLLVDESGWIKTCNDLSAHFIAFIQRKYDEYDELYIVFDKYGIPKSLKSATRHLRLGNSYPVAYHSTDTTNISLRKLLSNTAKKDELTVFSSKELLEFSNENKLYTVVWQNKAEASHRDVV